MYDEAALKAILKRAMELDASRASGLMPEQIVQIAGELGISETAVREALQERDALESVQSTIAITTHRISSTRVFALSAGAGGWAGLLTTGVVAGPLIGIGVVGAALWPALIMVSGGLALTEKAGSVLRFVRRNTALWLGVGAGWAAVSQLFPMQSLGEVGSVRMAFIRTIMALVMTTAGGMTYLLLKRSPRGADQDKTPPQPTTGVFKRALARVAKSMRDLISPLHRRVATVEPKTTIETGRPAF